MKNIYTFFVMLGLVFSAIAHAERPAGFVYLSSESGNPFRFPDGVCVRPYEKFAIALMMRRDFRERIYGGDYLQETWWRVDTSGVRLWFNSSKPEEGAVIQRADGTYLPSRDMDSFSVDRALDLRGGVVEMGFRIPRGERVTIAVYDPATREVLRETHVQSVEDPSPEGCRATLPETAYRPQQRYELPLLFRLFEMGPFPPL